MVIEQEFRVGVCTCTEYQGIDRQIITLRRLGRIVLENPLLLRIKSIPIPEKNHDPALRKWLVHGFVDGAKEWTTRCVSVMSVDWHTRFDTLGRRYCVREYCSLDTIRTWRVGHGLPQAPSIEDIVLGFTEILERMEPETFYSWIERMNPKTA